jgi:DNA-binding PadR family transcriptional regulator
MSEPYYAAMSLRIAALGLLAEGPASGYDMLREFE